MFGIGAIAAVGAEAAPPPLDTGKPSRIPQRSDKVFGDLRVWSDGGRIYLSESGGAVQELLLGDTVEAQNLQQLLEQSGAVVDDPQVLQHRIILVGGGGEGFHWSGNPNAPAAAPESAGPSGATRGQVHGGPAKPARPASPGVHGTSNPTTGGRAG